VAIRDDGAGRPTPNDLSNSPIRAWTPLQEETLRRVSGRIPSERRYSRTPSLHSMQTAQTLEQSPSKQLAHSRSSTARVIPCLAVVRPHIWHIPSARRIASCTATPHAVEALCLDLAIPESMCSILEQKTEIGTLRFRCAQERKKEEHFRPTHTGGPGPLSTAAHPGPALGKARKAGRPTGSGSNRQNRKQPPWRIGLRATGPR